MRNFEADPICHYTGRNTNSLESQVHLKALHELNRTKRQQKYVLLML